MDYKKQVQDLSWYNYSTMPRFILFLLFCSLLWTGCSEEVLPDLPGSDDDPVELYFPAINTSDWDTSDPDSLEWNTAELDNLLSYLEEKKTKGFIILKDGRIVVEEYFNGHAQNTVWPWYSCAKSLTSVGVAIAVKQGHLNIEQPTSEYLGDNWSLLPKEKQDLITVRHHLSMTTGLKSNPNNFVEWTCTAPLCMQYEVDAGTRWAYHQGAFTQVQNILTKATGQGFKEFLKQELFEKIGMNGSWSQLLDVRIFSSSTRNMARFGLLAMNQGVWANDTLYNPEYHTEMTNTSQLLNEAYGYLWWLNGKSSFLGTSNQEIYSGSLIPNAPKDMYCALGAQDQKIYIVPSKNLVVVRSGEPAGTTQFASSSFDNELWGKLNLVFQE